jgi:methionyl-tRNA formyltransferase
MKFDRYIFLAGNNARSQAYAQTLEARGHFLDRAILFDRQGADQLGKTAAMPKPSTEGTVVLPDLSIPINDTCNGICGRVDRFDAKTVSDPKVVQAVAQAAADGAELAIYSGYGGQILSKQILAIGLPILHIHSGWLPDYRGSTTIYYSLLRGDSCGVSAILLREKLDEGPIIARRKYPPPPADLGIDFYYDPAIRADLMADTIESWSQSGGTGTSIQQSADDGEMFFVVHPLLKHLAILGLQKPR